MSSIAPFFHPFPAGNAFWQESRNAGASYLAAPAAASTTQVIGATGTQRFRQLFTIPPGVAGTYAVTVSGDTFANPPNVPARVVYDGVDQGPVTPISGPATFTLPVVAGAHDFQLWIGQATSAGATVPVVTAAFAGVILAGAGAAGCCCPISETARCYRVVTGSAFHRAYLVDCGAGPEWHDIVSGATVPADDIENCACGTVLELPDLHMAGAAFNDAPNEFICNVVPTPDVATGWAVTGVCYDPTVGAPSLDWTAPLSSVALEYGSAAGNSGGVILTFSSTLTGTITWATNLTMMNVGEQRISQALAGGIRAVLTYVSGPAGNASAGTIRMEGGGALGIHRTATNIVAPIRFRLDFYSAPCP
ncbi:hypothetical protein AB0F17_28725 [Nonomuraea sp. NPDC026600]|uniref:hypothetical protein n=1 Tax=Nonomuraea sp. NPDC026600 TaxID=3155363 RepID=UPI0033DFB010